MLPQSRYCGGTVFVFQVIFSFSFLLFYLFCLLFFYRKVKAVPEAAGEVSAEEAPKKAVKINEEAVRKAAKEFLDQVLVLDLDYVQ